MYCIVDWLCVCYVCCACLFCGPLFVCSMLGGRFCALLGVCRCAFVCLFFVFGWSGLARRTYFSQRASAMERGEIMAWQALQRVAFIYLSRTRSTDMRISISCS